MGKCSSQPSAPTKIDAQQIHVHRQSDLGDLAGQPRKGGVIQRRVREFCQEVARPRSGNHEAAAAARDIAQGDAAGRRPGSPFGVRQHLLQIVAVVALCRAGADDVVVLIGDFW